MVKLTLTDIQGQYASTTELNNNFTLIETALENTLSRDGTAPNTMSANIDMNNNDIVNANSVQVGGQSLVPDSVVAIDTAASVPNVPAGSIAATNVQTALNELDTEKAALASPTFTGAPASTTAALNDNSTLIATTAFVAGEIAAVNITYSGDAAGTADVITSTLSPTLTSLTDGTVVYVKALLANATTTPTFSPDGLTAYAITKEGSQALVAGDIARVDYELILRYNATNTVWELLNPIIAGDVGTVIVWPKATPKAGTLETDGAAVEIVDYINLYNVIGNDYGLNAGTTFTAAVTDVITATAHGLLDNDVIECTNSGGALPAGLAVDVTYYVINKTDNTFEVSLTEGGAAVDITGTGTGTHSFHNEILIPDYRGEFLRGFDNGAGNDPDAAGRTDRGDGTTGDVVGSKQADELGQHNHALYGRAISSSSAAGDNHSTYNSGSLWGYTNNTGGNESRPRNVNVMYCIKF